MPTKTLEEIYRECLLAAKAVSAVTVPTTTNGELYKWRGSVTSFASGKLLFESNRLFGLSICDDTRVIPCIVTDSAHSVHIILNMYDHKILIREPTFVVEIFISNSKEHASVHMFIDANKISQISNEPINIRNIEFDGDDVQGWYQSAVPLKVSSVILSKKKEVCCFVLVSLLNSVADMDENIFKNKKIWIVLRDEQVVWKDLLVLNRMFTMHMSSDISTDYFCANNKTLESVIQNTLDSSFMCMLHHCDLVLTNQAVSLPLNTRIQITNLRSKYVMASLDWHRVGDNRLNNVKFGSIVGIIQRVSYWKYSYSSKTCSWCDAGKNLVSDYRNVEIDKEQSFTNVLYSRQSWTNPWDGEVQLDNYKVIVPKINRNIDEKVASFRFGIKCGIYIDVALQDKQSGKILHIYLKQWILEQYPDGLVEGVTVCITDVNIRRSQKDNLYFISTPLTRIIHLSIQNEKLSFVNYCKFGFPNVKPRAGEVVWGMLDMELLSKVEISMKCKSCTGPIKQYQCINELCPFFESRSLTSFKLNATARLYVKGIAGFESCLLFLKNENVQKYLGFPDLIWNKLCQLSADSELLYEYSQSNEMQQLCDPVNILFFTYCKFLRPMSRFHFTCKPFKLEDDVDPRFFCIDLDRVTVESLANTRYTLNKLQTVEITP